MSTLLVSVGVLSSCHQNGMSSGVEQAAEVTKAQLHVGTSIALAMLFLKQEGFSCEPLPDRLENGSQSSLLCQKRIVEKRWWGLKEYHNLVVVIHADDTNRITSVDTRINWGGLRGL